MEINVLRNEKEELEAQIENITIAEILRVYLNEDSSVIFAVWKREHPTKMPVLLVKTKGKTAKKAIDDAVKAIVKDLDKVDSDYKKMK